MCQLKPLFKKRYLKREINFGTVTTLILNCKQYHLVLIFLCVFFEMVVVKFEWRIMTNQWLLSKFTHKSPFGTLSNQIQHGNFVTGPLETEIKTKCGIIDLYLLFLLTKMHFSSTTQISWSDLPHHPPESDRRYRSALLRSPPTLQREDHEAREETQRERKKRKKRRKKISIRFIFSPTRQNFSSVYWRR